MPPVSSSGLLSLGLPGPGPGVGPRRLVSAISCSSNSRRSLQNDDHILCASSSQLHTQYQEHQTVYCGGLWADFNTINYSLNHSLPPLLLLQLAFTNVCGAQVFSVLHFTLVHHQMPLPLQQKSYSILHASCVTPIHMYLSQLSGGYLGCHKLSPSNILYT